MLMVYGSPASEDEQAHAADITYFELLTEVRDGRIEQATIGEMRVIARKTNGTVVQADITAFDQGLVGELTDNQIPFKVKDPGNPSIISNLAASWFPMLLLLGVFVYFYLRYVIDHNSFLAHRFPTRRRKGNRFTDAGGGKKLAKLQDREHARERIVFDMAGEFMATLISARQTIVDQRVASASNRSLGQS